MKPRFSAIVPTCQRNDSLALCLARLAPGKQTLPSEQYEVIVTDDGSVSTAEALVRECFPWARWFQGPRKGPAANRNHGACQAQGEWLVFTDDDCLPQPGWLAAYAESAGADSTNLVLEGQTLPAGERTGLLQDCPINDRGGNLWSCNFAIRRELFRELNGFDERFLFAAMEDVDLAYRLRQRGDAALFVPAALIFHPWKRVDFRRQRRQHLWSELMYLKIHPEESVSIHWRYHVRGALLFWLREFPGFLREFPGETIRHAPLVLCDQFRTIMAHWWKREPEALGE